MGYEPTGSAAARLQLIYSTTHDAALRHSLALVMRPASGQPEMQPDFALAPSAAPYVPPSPLFSGIMPRAERPAEVEFGMNQAQPCDLATSAERWFDTEPLLEALATPETVRDLLACVAAQQRALALVQAAEQLGAATMPREIAEAVQQALASLPTLLGRAALAHG